jgi:IS1 family transposase
MEKLTTTQRATILRCLVEGNSVASTTRMTGHCKPAILAVLNHVGAACEDYHRENAVALSCEHLQLDEQWSYCDCKEATKAKAKRKDLIGDVWCWMAICADSKFIVNWHVGGRTLDDAMFFCRDLGERFVDAPQVSADGLNAYRVAVPAGFGECDFAQMIKQYGEVNGKTEVIGIRRVRRTGTPDMDRLSTSYAERQNLTSRVMNRRLTRCTIGYSKKFVNHCHQLALAYFTYNYCRKHMTLKKTPAQAMGVASYQWDMADVVEMADARAKAMEEAMFAAALADKFESL